MNSLRGMSRSSWDVGRAAVLEKNEDETMAVLVYGRMGEAEGGEDRSQAGEKVGDETNIQP